MGKYLGRSVSIIGAGYTPLGKIDETPGLEGYTERELFAEAAILAMQNGGIDAKDIDAYYVGCVAPNSYLKVVSAAPHFSDFIGMNRKPAIFHDEACATSGFGLHQAVMAVASGAEDCVISIGINSATSMPRPGYPGFFRGPLDMDTIFNTCYTAHDPNFEKPGMGGMAGIEAALSRYLHTYGYSADDYQDAMVEYLRTMSWNSLSNPRSTTFPMSVDDEAKALGFASVQDYLRDDTYNPKIGAYIRARFIGATVDGAAAIIVCATEDAYKYTDKPIEVAGIGSSTFHDRDYLDFPNKAMTAGYKKAYEMAGITDPGKEIDYMGIHDCTGLSLFTDCECGGYFEPGQGLRSVLEGRVAHDADKPINTSGGRMILGHPLAGAYGIEITEAVSQMRGECGPRQMENPPKTAVVSIAGTGFSFATTVLRSLA